MTLDYTKIDKKFHLYDRSMDEKNKSFIYGEVDYIPFIKLLKDDIHFFPGDNFLDIGSGCGKFLSGLSCQDFFNEMYFQGVEIHSSRYNQSLKLQDELDFHDNLEFINDDFHSIYFGNYDVLYCCNTIFGDEENKNLYSKIENEFTGYFILFEYDKTFEKYLIKNINAHTSWGKSVPVYIFQK